MKTFYYLILTCLFFSSSSLISQDTSRYNSLYQAELFQRIEDSAKFEALEVMISLDFKEGNEEKINSAFSSLYKSLEPEKLKSKKAKKQIKSIYKEIHDAKLKKYIMDADFIQLFDQGEYNCVSATALYAEIFDRFNIEYEIRETPTHVYLVADPKGEKILIETTLPENGAIEYDYKTQKDYVNYLKDNKLISEEEFENNPIEKLFDEYFDKNEIINKKQLAALLYYNRGVELYNEEEYKNASFNLKLAYTIYPSANIHFLANYSMLNGLIVCEKENSFDPLLLADYVRLNQEESEFSKLGVNHFSYVGNELMIVHPDPESYFQYYESFTSALDSTFDLNYYKLEFNNRIYYYHFMKREYPEALMALKISYDINPENLQTREAIFNTSGQHFMNDKNHIRNLDSIVKYIKVFPFLAEDEKVIAYYNYSQMRVIREYLSYGNLDKALANLDQFEAKLKANGNDNVDRNYFAEVYIDLANYHLRKERVSSATAALKRGLEMDPSSPILIERYKMLFRMNVEYNQQQEMIKSFTMEAEDSYEERFDKWFVACWKIDGKLSRASEETDYDKTFKIMSYKDNKLSYVIDGKTRSGTFSLRKTSKILYLVPNDDKDDYTMFKLESVNDREMILMPFKDKKLTGERIYMSKC